MMTDEEMICYCFHYTIGDIRRDAVDHGESIILQKIVAAKQTGECDCVNKHPKGT